MSSQHALQKRNTTWRLVATTAVIAVGTMATGCATVVPVHATAYDIQVDLDPADHRLDGQTTLHIEADASQWLASRPVAVDIALHAGLRVHNVTAEAATLRGVTSRQAAEDHDRPDHTGQVQHHADRPPLAVHRIALTAPEPSFAITLHYSGRLEQRVQAGEHRGQIHNVLMSTHVGSNGVYLEPAGRWYPTPYLDPEERPRSELAEYRLSVGPVDGMRLVASAELDTQASEQTGRMVWISRYPLDGLVLAGGPHQVKQREVDGIILSLHYAPPAADEARRVIEDHGDLFLNAAEEYLRRYTPLVGPYPFERFTIVENFFSSGFAFPGFTLLSPVLLQMGEKALKHGYLDHELLHSWWGNSIYVNPNDGNWCEALASYGANLYGYVLDGDEEGARKHRRNCCNSLSRIKPKDDKPLGTFGQEQGAGRAIGYSKGSMVFHMLARQIGQETFWDSMRRLTSEYTGRHANWASLQEVCERESGEDLSWFFGQWVRQAGAPGLKLHAVAWDVPSKTLTVTVDQEGTDFMLDVPLRLIYQDGSCLDETVAITAAREAVPIKLETPPASVVLDPDYHVFRKLQPAEIMPTSATTRGQKSLLIVKPTPDVSPFYETVIRAFTGRSQSREVTTVTAADVTPEQLQNHPALILGNAVRHPTVLAHLARTQYPITWEETGFRIDGTLYDQPGHSVLCTVHHPDVPEWGLTVYYGNTEDALGRSDLLLFYGNSLLVFNTTCTESGEEKEYRSDVVLRKDFESQEQIDVTR